MYIYIYIRGIYIVLYVRKMSVYGEPLLLDVIYIGIYK